MKTLNNHTLVYDSECPMCDIYTKGFIKAGMLDNNGRVAYGCARVPVTFNNEKARNEIALIDYNTYSVTYGIDSLIKVVAHSFPTIGKILRFKAVKVPLGFLYSLISYNRKVIAPPHVFEKPGACTPNYHFAYRVAYIILAWIITSLVLTRYSNLLVPLVPPTNIYREFLICGGQIIFQMVFVLMMKPGKLLHYIGNMMTVSLIGALLLLPMVIVNNIGSVDPLIALAWFGAVVTFMLFIHWRRMRWLGITAWATGTWIVYRLIVLCLILL